MGQFIPKFIDPASWDQMLPKNTYALKLGFEDPVRLRFGSGLGLYVEISKASVGHVINMLSFESGEPTLLGKLNDDVVTIVGRTSDCQIKVAQPVMSRQHLELKVWQKKVLIARDLGSTNGTFLWSDIPVLNLTNFSADIETPDKLFKQFGVDIAPLLNEYSQPKG